MIMQRIHRQDAKKTQSKTGIGSKNSIKNGSNLAPLALVASVEWAWR